MKRTTLFGTVFSFWLIFTALFTLTFFVAQATTQHVQTSIELTSSDDLSDSNDPDQKVLPENFLFFRLFSAPDLVKEIVLKGQPSRLTKEFIVVTLLNLPPPPTS
mgnify:CR=1